MNSSNSSPDIVVVGTGIVGLACALAFARRGQRVALLGPKEPLPPAGEHFDPRVYALSPSSRDFLAVLGIWDNLPAERIAGVRAMDVEGAAPARRASAGAGGEGRVHLSAWQGAMGHLAWIAESTELERALRQAVQWLGVPWIIDSFASLESPGERRPVLATVAGRRIEAGLAVAADGARSALRSAAGIDVRRADYEALGLVVHLQAELPHQDCACQWFTPDGVLALLPMPDSHGRPLVSMVWSMPSAKARYLLELPEGDQATTLEAMLADATRGRLGALRAQGRLLGFPLALQTSRALTAPGVALVGDAAHVIHPLAGQGLNLGLGDVEALVGEVAGREPFRPVDDERILRRYRRARAEPLLAMRVATDGLQRLFALQAPPAAWLRNAGMNAVDQLPFFKRALIRQASGSWLKETS